MYLGCYHFDGDPAELLPAYQRMLEGFPPDLIQFQVSVRRADGLQVYDSCPTRDDFVQFSGSPQFAAALSAAGLPQPRIEELGEIHMLITAPAVTAP